MHVDRQEVVGGCKMQNCVVLFCGLSVAKCVFPNSPKLCFEWLNELVPSGVLRYIKQTALHGPGQVPFKCAHSTEI